MLKSSDESSSPVRIKLPTLDDFKNVLSVEYPCCYNLSGYYSLGSDHPLQMGPIGIRETGNSRAKCGPGHLDRRSLHVVPSVMNIGFLHGKQKVVIDIDRTAHLKKTLSIDLYINADASRFSSVRNAPLRHLKISGRSAAGGKTKYQSALKNIQRQKKESICVLSLTLSRLLREGDVVVSDADPRMLSLRR
jgi:hypothetical protein